MIFEVDNTTEMLIKELQESIKSTISSLSQGQNDIRMMVEGLKNDIRGISAAGTSVAPQAPVEVQASVDTTEIQRMVEELKAEIKNDIRGIQISAPVVNQAVPTAPVEVQASVDTTEIEKLIADMKTELMGSIVASPSSEQSASATYDVQNMSMNINSNIQQMSSDISGDVQKMAADIRNEIKEASASIQIERITSDIQMIDAKLATLMEGSQDTGVSEELDKVAVTLESLKMNGTDSANAIAKLEESIQVIADKVEKLGAENSKKSAELADSFRKEQEAVLKAIEALKSNIAGLSVASQINSVNDNVSGIRSDLVEILSNKDDGAEKLEKILQSIEKYESLFNSIETKLLAEVAKFNDYSTKAMKIDEENNRMLFEVTRYLRKPGYKRFLTGM